MNRIMIQPISIDLDKQNKPRTSTLKLNTQLSDLIPILFCAIEANSNRIIPHLKAAVFLQIHLRLSETLDLPCVISARGGPCPRYARPRGPSGLR